MDKAELKRLIDTAAGRVPPDLVIRGTKLSPFETVISTARIFTSISTMEDLKK